MLRLILGLLLLIPMAGPALAADEPVIEIVQFAEGRDEFTKSEQDKLLPALAAAKKSGAIEEILVAAWSDKEFPATIHDQLTRDDEQLARSRGDNIKAFLRGQKTGAKVETFSMAKYPSWLARAFRTDEAKLKQAMQSDAAKGKSRDDVALAYFGKMLRDKGGPFTAAIVIRGRSVQVAH